MASNIQHSNSSAQWGTAPEIVEVTHKVLGPRAITVDPFSEPEFNARIGADRILTGAPGADAYHDRWLDDPDCPRADWLLAGFVDVPKRKAYGPDLETSIVNPPSGEEGDNVKRAYRLLELYHRLGWFPGGAIYVGFSLNQLQTLQMSDEVPDADAFRSPLHRDWTDCRCIPRKRSAFVPHSTRPYFKALEEFAKSKRLKNREAALAAFNATPLGLELYNRHVNAATKTHGAPVDLDEAPSHPSFFLLMPTTSKERNKAQRAMFIELAGRLGEVF
jgi:hypothetical protein